VAVSGRASTAEEAERAGSTGGPGSEGAGAHFPAERPAAESSASASLVASSQKDGVAPASSERARPRALALVSGGLDSALAVRALLEQGVPVTALTFVSVFSPGRDPSGRLAARAVTEAMGVPLLVRDATRDMLSFVPEPRYGWGRNANPCLDCRVHHLREAGQLMKELGASYVVTGEVLGQRPMSQHREALARVERESGLEGLVLRPLTALNLEPSLPEQRGWVDRSRLFGISGRSRKTQNELARRWGLVGYTSPAGGCLLTDPQFAWRLQEFLSWGGRLTANEAHLLKYGRHFRLGASARAIVGRDERENARIVSLRRPGDWVLAAAAGSSPETLLRGEAGRGELVLAARLTARYSRHRHLSEVEVIASRAPVICSGGPPAEELRLRVSPIADEEADRLAVRRPGKA